jgi:hypothetical protein
MVAFVFELRAAFVFEQLHLGMSWLVSEQMPEQRYKSYNQLYESA